METNWARQAIYRLNAVACQGKSAGQSALIVALAAAIEQLDCEAPVSDEDWLALDPVWRAAALTSLTTCLLATAGQ